MKSAKHKHLATHISCMVNRKVLGDELGNKVQTRFESLLESNGVEWTVARYKAIYQAALHLRNGDKDRALSIYQDSSIAYTKDLYPKEPMGQVVKGFVETKRGQTARKLAGVMRIYSLLTLRDASQKQLLKVNKSINGEYSGKTSPLRLFSFGLTGAATSVRNRTHPVKGDLVDNELPLFSAGVVNLLKASGTQDELKVIQLIESVCQEWTSCDPKTIPQNNVAGSAFKLGLNNQVRLGFSEDPRYNINNISGTNGVFSRGSTKFFNQFSTGRDPKEENPRYAGVIHSLATNFCLPTSVLGRFTDISRMDNHYLNCVTTPEYWGRISIIQEGGAKPRCVAVPSASVQMVFEPLHRHLNKVTELLFARESCVNDQEKGIMAVRENQMKGETVYSVDLSSATDRFPLEIQEGVLVALGLPEYASALRQVARGPWKPPKGATERTWTYSVGQPMGLYGSFALFHLSHLVTADYLASGLKARLLQGDEPLTEFKDGSLFKILGDDVVFSDRRLAQDYKQLMANIGVETSPTKSFEGKMAEFAGFISFPLKGSKIATFQPYKYPSKTSFVSNPIPFMEAFAQPPSNNKRWNRIYRAYEASRPLRNMDLSPGVDVSTSPYSQAGLGNYREFTADDLKDGLQSIARVLKPAYGELQVAFFERVMKDTHPSSGINHVLPLQQEVTENRFRKRPESATRDPLIKDAMTKQYQTFVDYFCLMQGITEPKNDFERNIQLLDQMWEGGLASTNSSGYEVAKGNLYKPPER